MNRFAHVCALIIVLTGPTCLAADTVLCGVDVLQRDGFRQLTGQGVGLITNHTGLTRDGVSTATLLHEASNVSLTALFSPEHGFEGKLDISKIDDTADQSTGLKIFSLYGKTRRPDSRNAKWCRHACL